MTLAAVAIVRRTTESDLVAIAIINEASFQGNRGKFESALEWVGCWFRAFPLYQYFVIEIAGKVVGYIGWEIHGGFRRSEPVVELEQIALDLEYQGKKLGPKLIYESRAQIVEFMRTNNGRIPEAIVTVVWAYATNTSALKAYEDAFPDGIQGMRIQYDGRTEVMMRMRISLSQTP